MTYTWTRDLRGYAGAPPHPQWPNGARIAVSVVLNVEEGAESSLLAGDTQNEVLYDMLSSVQDVVNLSMASNFAYGARAGYWRVADMLDKYAVRCSVNACAVAFEQNPVLAADCARRGYDIVAHGYRWRSHAHMDVVEERATIGKAVETIGRLTGHRPVGWQTRSPAGLNTRRLLIEEGGFLYDSDTTEDDLPYLIDLGDRDYVVLPYTSDVNDIFLQRAEGSRLGRHFSEHAIGAFDWLYGEGATSPKMLTIALHGRAIGRPGRIGALEAILQHIRSREHVWFATRGEIARHWIQQFGKYGR